MQILFRPRYKVLIKVVKGWWGAWKLPFHDSNEVLGDLLNLIFCKKIGDLQTGIFSIKSTGLKTKTYILESEILLED